MAHISRTTVDNYFQILEDTLIGFRLPAHREGAKSKEIQHSKFYFFDQGVARGCAGLLDQPTDSVWKGFALETLLLNELRANFHYSQKSYSLYHYGISGSYDIDFIIETQKKTISTPREVILISVNPSQKWDRRWNEPLLEFETTAKSKVKKIIGIYRGAETLTFDKVSILPLETFLNQLHSGALYQ